jgi:probable HAF family extracellular repeat protein
MHYDIDALPGPSNAESHAYGLSAKGDVVGLTWPTEQGKTYTVGARWSGGVLNYTMPLGSDGFFYGVNSGGNSVGARGWGNSTTQVPVVLDAGTLKDMSPPVPVGSFSAEINESNRACGWSWNDPRSFVYDVATKSILSWINPLPGATESTATAINDIGEVVGLSDGDAFIYSGGALKSLGDVAFVTGINESSVVCGSVGKPYPANFRAATCDAKQNSPTWTDLPLPVGAIGSHGNGINDQGEVVGTYWTAETYNGAQSAYVYKGGVITDLNTVISAPGWHLESASQINNDGQICGRGTLDGKQMGFLLTPHKAKFPDDAYPDGPKLSLPMLVATLIGGVAKDGGGWAVVGGRPIPIDPWGPWTTIAAEKRDALLALAIDEVAMFISDATVRERVRRSLIESAKTRLDSLAVTAAMARSPRVAARNTGRTVKMHSGQLATSLLRFRKRAT